MTIKDVKKLTGLTEKSIRYYEDKGLINVERNENNDYRNYTKEDVEKLKLIKILRYIDFSIEEIATIFENNNLSDALRNKSKDLESESNKYLDKQTICNALLKDCQKKEIHRIVDDYNDTISFLETDEGKEMNFLYLDFLCPSLSAIVIQSLIYIGPILWLFINIYSRKWDALVFNAISAIICTSLLVIEWTYYFGFKRKHKEGTKTKNRKNVLMIPIMIITIIFVIISYVLLNMSIAYFIVPKDYLFFETSNIFTKLTLVAIMIVFIAVIGTILKKLKINKIEELDIDMHILTSLKGLGMIIVVVILYGFFTSVQIVTENKIIYRDFFHPLGVSYDYSDVDKIETGFGDKNFSLVDYKRKGEFYYSLFIENKEITFSIPTVNEKIERYEYDSYLELEEFDQKLMQYNIEKISHDEYESACDLDQQYCDRFMRIINNKK